MTITFIGSPVANLEPSSARPSAAAALGPERRKSLAIEVLAGGRPVSGMAGELGVSRKFLHRQAEVAGEALDAAFRSAGPPGPPSPAGSDGPAEEKPLFHLPVTKAWVRQFALAQVLIGHTSYRGVGELLRDLFDHDLSEGTMHNIVMEAVAAARKVNAAEDLAGVRIAAHDEIFQNGRPVLVGCDADSTYCHLLSPEEHRDADTWGVRLLELAERGLKPDAVVADFGAGLRAGQARAWPDTPCRGDVFHALQGPTALATYLENRALGALADLYDVQRRRARADAGDRRGRPAARPKSAGPADELRAAAEAEAAVALADDVALLSDWLRRDVLSLSGPDHAARRELLDFIVRELTDREPLCRHRIGKVRSALQNQGDSLLAFAAELDERIAAAAAAFQVAPSAVRAMVSLETGDPRSAEHGRREAELRSRLGERFRALESAAAGLVRGTVRASSVVENLNGRLRCWFHLRRHLGPDYLELLRFFLNHRRFLRSERPERAGKSPAELLTGRPHPHWLDLLGFQRHRRN